MAKRELKRRIKKIIYEDGTKTYSIFTEDAGRFGYPLTATDNGELCINKEIYEQLQQQGTSGWSHITYVREGCYDRIISLEKAREHAEKRPRGEFRRLDALAQM